MATLYSRASRALQDRFDTRRLADRLADVKVHDQFTSDDRDFIEARDMLFLATVDSSGQPTCSYKGGDPGFVAVLDDRRLAFPSYDGNGMFLSMGNVAESRGVGVLFTDFEKQRRLRVDGSAEIAFDHPLGLRCVGAQFIVLVTATRIYPNCPRYIHRYDVVDRSTYVPRTAVPTPVPAWKRSEWAADVLPSNDPAKRADE
jgi:predicted pyridoxine 5'-phosphate oxidase superfamily flavin-nucleotide-binding protein